ncbi:hypothetical protein [Paenibacillus silvae]|uniref:hypothetical protein n=1 Tax=Paenibacillus silvae TaxID=1325358 RepID=UPI0011B48ED3|nr:hypothetical protein [Paenibacillus silvae]
MSHKRAVPPLQGQTKLIVDISSEAGGIEQCSRDGWFAYCMSKADLNMHARLIHNGLWTEARGQTSVAGASWLGTELYEGRTGCFR